MESKLDRQKEMARKEMELQVENQRKFKLQQQ